MLFPCDILSTDTVKILFNLYLFHMKNGYFEGNIMRDISPMPPRHAAMDIWKLRASQSRLIMEI
jgi:hypothetical protein